MKRSFKSFLTLYIALYKLYLDELADKNLLIEKELRERVISTITGFYDYRNVDECDASVTKFSRNSRFFR